MYYSRASATNFDYSVKNMCISYINNDIIPAQFEEEEIFRRTMTKACLTHSKPVPQSWFALQCSYFNNEIRRAALQLH